MRFVSDNIEGCPMIAGFTDECLGTLMEVREKDGGVLFSVSDGDRNALKVGMDREELRDFVSYLTGWIEMKDKEDVQ